jgi:hypothetical protein
MSTSRRLDLPNRLRLSIRYRLRELVEECGLPLARRLTNRWYIPLDYPPPSASRPRYGYGLPPHPGLREILARHEDRYRPHLELLIGYRESLLAIPREPEDPGQPYWRNPWLSGLDAISLYCFLRSRAPAQYVEIGSGVSTLFARRAIGDGSLRTSVTSIDPAPRTEIDAVCDVVVRRPLEEVDAGIFEQLTTGDVVFLDGSHRVFMNSDVTVFFLEVLPNLASGVLVGVHDIYLPDDYPPEGSDWFASEQYLLAAYLLAEPPWLEPILPCNYVTSYSVLNGLVAPLLSDAHFDSVTRRPGSFWFSIRR